MSVKTLVVAGGSIAALMIAGCAYSPERQAAGDPYAAALYTGAPQPDRADHFAHLYAPEQTSQNGTPYEIVSYAGIEGARRAHARYTEEEAEKLDGRCERYVEASASESLIDVANLCDIPLEMLVDYNPDIKNVSYSAPGAVIEIPGGTLSPSGTLAMKDALADIYIVEDGDTLETIAQKLNISESSLTTLNPEVYWSDPTPGMAIKKPVVAPVASIEPRYAPPTPAPVWEGYAAGQGIGASEAGSAIGTAHAPYQLKPSKSYARPVGAYPEARLVVDREFVKEGDSVKVTAKAKPGADVTFYSGAEPGALKKSKTVRADENGDATASIDVKEGSTMGGVIFGARPKGSSETQYSDRVGVVKLKPERPRDSADEEAEDAEEETEED
ncbi:MAG: LysM peptidoglycan-binding domain-containing protein [Parvularculaceae bacterium]|nr:LysM peptidoglycan-binding domain-containing protein [Parvularculaceae bacterium]